jgi:hypothetical protein
MDNTLIYNPSSNIEDLLDIYNNGKITFLSLDNNTGINSVRIICCGENRYSYYAVNPIFKTISLIHDTDIEIKRIFDIVLSIDENGYVLSGNIFTYNVNGECLELDKTQKICKNDKIHYTEFLCDDGIWMPNIRFKNSQDFVTTLKYSNPFVSVIGNVMSEDEFIRIIKDSDEYKYYIHQTKVAETHANIIKEGIENAGETIAKPLASIAYFMYAKLAFDYPGSKIAMAYRMSTGF